MKFGLWLSDHLDEEWRPMYLDYDGLKQMIRSLAEVEGKSVMEPEEVTHWATNISLTVPPPQPNATVPPARRQGSDGGEGSDAGSAGRRGESASGLQPYFANVTHEQFFAYLEKEIQKVHSFTHRKVEQIRADLEVVARQLGIHLNSVPGRPIEASSQLRAKVDKIGHDFLRVEKYVNLNYTGFHKILKKHDRWLSNPCRGFYLQRLQNHNWTRGDYSDVLVSLSRIWSCLRGDVTPEAVVADKQDFVRSTTKYWVKAEDVSAVKYIVLQNLPVLLQKSAEAEDRAPDSQLINSVYLDNATLELYKGRLDKTPGAIAIRFRWYGTGTPDTVFVERKTHRDKWTTEMSVKERFTVHASEVPDILAGRFNKEPHLKKMREKGKSDKDIQAWDTLVTEICQAVVSKQLVPTLRTQYMRTAFQIPYDATVRISLDSNLLMLTETGRLSHQSDRWYRDPRQPVPKTEITRFPHAVLEVKLQLKDEASKPTWVAELLDSGMVHEVHKFSKFIHGCAVLLPEEVQAMPYWIDDPSLRDSIVASGAAELCGLGRGINVGANAIYTHLLPHAHGRAEGPEYIMQRTRRTMTGSSLGVTLGARKPSFYEDDEEAGGPCECCPTISCWAGGSSATNQGSSQKVLPKVYLANERTFIHWLHMSVTMTALGAIVLAFSPGGTMAEMYGFILMPVAIVFALYALYNYHERISMIPSRDDGRWDDPLGPTLLSAAFAVALSAQLVFKLAYFYRNVVA